MSDWLDDSYPAINSSDPVFHNEGKWYFWDEVWIDSHGPYDTEEECRKAVIEYGDSL